MNEEELLREDGFTDNQIRVWNLHGKMLEATDGEGPLFDRYRAHLIDALGPELVDKPMAQLDDNEARAAIQAMEEWLGGHGE